MTPFSLSMMATCILFSDSLDFFQSENGFDSKNRIAMETGKFSASLSDVDEYKLRLTAKSVRFSRH